MARRKLTVDRYAEIKRRLAEGRGVREISRALGCSRRLVREIKGENKQVVHSSQVLESILTGLARIP
jgi:DNA invertase Pin-like site-specific DNA recombinase